MLRPSAFAVDQEAEWSDPNEATSLKYVPTRGSLNKQVPGLTKKGNTHCVPFLRQDESEEVRAAWREQKAKLTEYFATGDPGDMQAFRGGLKELTSSFQERLVADVRAKGSESAEGEGDTGEKVGTPTQAFVPTMSATPEDCISAGMAAASLDSSDTGGAKETQASIK